MRSDGRLPGVLPTANFAGAGCARAEAGTSQVRPRRSTPCYWIEQWVARPRRSASDRDRRAGAGRHDRGLLIAHRAGPAQAPMRRSGDRGRARHGG